MTAAGWLIAGGALSAMVIVFVVGRMRAAGRTLDTIVAEHHDRMAQLSHQALAENAGVVPGVPVARRPTGAHRRQPGHRVLPAADSRRRPMSA